MAGNQQRCGKREQLEEWYSQALVHFHDYAEARIQQKAKFRLKEQFMDPYTKESRRRDTLRGTTSLAQGVRASGEGKNF